MKNQYYIHLRRIYFVSIICLLFSCASEQKTKPIVYTDGLIDEVNLFKKSENDSLKFLIKDFSVKNGVELMMVIKDSLRGKTLLDLSEEIYDQSRLTKIKSGKWVLIVMVTTAREFRINVGKGSEDRLSDKNCDIVLRKNIIPLFKQSKYFEGMRQGIICLTTVLEQNKF